MNLQSLPAEVLAKIFWAVAVEDLPACMDTCHHFKELIQSLVLNRALRHSRLPEVLGAFEEVIGIEQRPDDTARARKLLQIAELNLNAKRSSVPLISMAILNQKPKIAQLMLEREDLDVNATNVCGVRPLHFALTNGFHDLVAKFMAHRNYRPSRKNPPGGAYHIAIAAMRCDAENLSSVRDGLYYFQRLF